MWEGEHPAGSVPQGMALETYKAFNEALGKGLGGQIKYGEPNYQLQLELKSNLAVFTAFRKHAANLQLVEQLTNPDGSVRSFREFRRAVSGLTNNYFVNWLEAEYEIAVKSARAAAQWKEFERTAHLYPNLEYMPSGAAEPREDHKKWYGLIRAIDDPVWDHITPPNGWGCDCSLRRTRKEADNTRAVDLPVPVKGIPGNAGKEGRVFTPDHPYVANANQAAKDRVREAFEQLKLKIPYNPKPDYRAKRGGSVYVHDFADQKDLPDNFLVAKAVVDEYGWDMRITPHVHIDGKKNPEYLINGKVSDLKHQQGKNVYKNISRAVSQECEVVVFKLEESSPLSVVRLFELVRGALMQPNRTHRIGEVVVYDKVGKLHRRSFPY